MHSKVPVRPHPGNADRAPVPIVARIVDKGELHPHVKAAHQVRVVISLAHLLAAVIQTAITQDEPQAAEGQVFPVLGADAAGFIGAPELVFFSAPPVAEELETERHGAVHLRIGKRLLVPFIPPGTEVGAEVGREFLLQIDTEALLQ